MHDVLDALWHIGPIKGAIVGAGLALGRDVWRWSESDDPFNWKKSFKRTVSGAIAGTGLFGVLNAVS